MRKSYTTVFLVLFALIAEAQIVNIPDANFKNALVNTPCAYEWNPDDPVWMDVDTNDDGEIQESEAAAIGGLKVDGLNIGSLEGIQYFTGLRGLDCSNNQITSLEMTSQPLLLSLDCSHNQLASLSVDFFMGTDILEYELSLNCSYNQLTALALPDGYLFTCNLSHNQLTSLTYVPNTYIEYLNVSHNSFVDLLAVGNYVTLTDCPFMTNCSIQARIAATVENNPALLYAEVGPKGWIDIHNNPILQSINLKDGQASMIVGSMSDPHYNFTGSPSLEFVCVDDIGYWHDEGGNIFYQDEMSYVQVSAGVNKTVYCDFTPGGGYNTLSGTVHYDCGGADLVLQNADVKINFDQNSNGSIDGATTPDNSGNFTFYTSGSGTIAPVFEGNYFTVTPASQSFSFAGIGGTQMVDFCVSTNGVHPDLEVAIVPISPARPGFDAIYKIVYTNKGTVTQSGSVTLAFEDDISDFVSATTPVDSQSTGSLSWNFSGLLPFENREITLTLNVNSPLETPAVNIDDVLDFTVSLDTAETDETPSDNTNVLTQIVVGSFDPNDKAVSRFSIPPTALDQYLYYTVRFQNTGTFYAENVVVRDLLDTDKLDLTTFEIVASSHPCRTLLTGLPTQAHAKKLEVFYEGIALPAAQDDEPGSHGFVTFKVKPKTTLVLNDVISNKAEIYFDYNSAIVTNTVTTTVTALGIGETAADHFALYPNPTKNRLTIALQNNASVKRISVYNTLGQLVKSIVPAFENGTMTTDTDALNAGTYFVQLVTDKGTTTKKLIKL